MSGFFQTAVGTGKGHAVVVANSASSATAIALLHRMGLTAAALADPYITVAEIARQPQGCNAVVLSLQSLFREELAVIGTIKTRFPHLAVWLTHVDGRTAALAEATRLGADAILTEEGVHPLTAAAIPPPPQSAPLPTLPRSPIPPTPPMAPVVPVVRNIPRLEAAAPLQNEPTAYAEPVLSADELRALLHDDGEDVNGGGQ